MRLAKFSYQQKYGKKERKNIQKFNKKLKKLSAEKPLLNKAEEEFRQLIKSRRLELTKSGFPDFMVYDKYHNILAFVEVKRNRKECLKATQSLFRKFCEKRNIPYYVWHPNEDIPLSNL